ncbi:MAG: hypothetical protein EP344_13420 [Bacteroidetes bacterium]|nr:MAG: hypothetical protein EP344_13420 [Bacteroidota bacterium]
MPEKQKVYDAGEMAMLYDARPNQWLLLEVLERTESGRAKKLNLLKTAKDKEDLYTYLMDEIEDWDWSRDFIFVYSDPEKQCDLL